MAAIAFAVAAPGIAANSAAAGIAISNVATATYEDGNGATYSGSSNEVVASVQAVGALSVTPKETAPNTVTESAAINSSVVRTFTISNVSNIDDAYTITAVGAGSQTVSVAFVSGSTQIPVTIGSTVSPTLHPGESIAVAVTVSTAGMSLGSQVAVTLTAQTTNTSSASGLQHDSGQTWIVGAHGANIVGPGGGGTQITKTVDKTAMVQTAPGSTVTFDIVAMNAGDAAATNASVTDTIPDGLTCDLSTVKLNAQPVPMATLSGQTLTVPIGTFAAGATIDVSFACAVTNAQTLGLTFVNIASISADGVSQKTTPASVLTGSANVVFDGYAGSSRPVGGAVVTLLDANGEPVKISGSSSFAHKLTLSSTPSAATNPFVTGTDGRYGFPLSATDVGSGKRFYLTIGAPGYLNRRIALDIAPGAGDPLYNVSATAQDGQPLAVAGGFTLTSTAVQLKDVFGLFGNLPLFAARNVQVQKTADRSYAQQGDRVVFTVDFSNASSAALGATDVVDIMPAGLMYAHGTATMDATPFEPEQDGQKLTWHLPKLAANETHRIVYASVILPNVAPGSSLTNEADVSGLVPGTLANSTGRSSVSVKVIDGAFSQRIIITGRVFADVNHNGRFTRGDKGLSGVRVYLEDGSAALTDAQGRFSFPGAHPGMHVLRVDAATLPGGYRATQSLQKLIHGLLDDGLMEDVEFAVEVAQ